MFNKTNTASVIEPTHDVVSADSVPLSHLSLDVDEPSVGWLIELDRRHIAVLVDDVGREAISRDDARMLITEHRAQCEAAEARQRAVREEQERQAVAADQAFRAALPKGVPWYRLPDGMTPGDAMALAAAEASHQKSVQESLLEQEFGGPQNSMVYQSFSNDAAES